MRTFRTKWAACVVFTFLAALLSVAPTGSANDNPALGIGEPTTPPCPDPNPCGCPPDPNCCPKPPCCKKPPCDCKGSGSPVSAQFGGLHLPFTDLEYNIGDIQFEIERSYGSDEFYVGYFGVGVTSTLDQMSISTFNGGTNHELVIVRTPQGKRYDYLRQPDSSYTGPVGHYDRLTKVGAEFRLTNLDGTVWSFDADTGFLLSRADKNGHAVTFSYDTSGRPDAIELFPGRNVTIAYGANGFVDSITDFGGRTISYTYDAQGLLTGFVDAESQPWTYNYAPAGLLTAVVSPLGHTIVSVTYDSKNRVSRMIDREGDYTYTYASGSTTKRNNALSTILATNVNQILYYDSQGVITRINEPNNSNTFYSYSATFNLTRQTDRHELFTDYLYDAQGRVTRETYPDASFKLFTWHPTLAQKTSETDERGFITLWEYDATGNVTRQVEGSGTPRQQISTWEYDAAGRVTRQVDPAGLEMTMAYDALGQITQQGQPGPVTLTYEYDLLGNLTRAQDQTGNELLLEYDSLLRKDQVTDPVGNVATRTYDPAGRLVGRVDSVEGNFTYEYNPLGLLTRETDGRGASIQHFLTGPYLTRDLDDLGREVLYAYDNTGAMTRLTRHTGDGDRITNFGRDTAGRQTSEAGVSGITESRTYDNRNRVATVTRSDGFNESFLYDTASNLTRKNDMWGNVLTTAFDELNRDTTISDSFGTRYQIVRDGGGRESQRILPRGTRGYEYDPAGRLTRSIDADGQPTVYQYDALGRHTSMARPGGETLTAVLDGLGRPTSATRASGRSTSWTYLGLNYPATFTEQGGRVTQFEYDGTFTVTRMTLPDGSEYGYGYDAGARLTQRTLPSAQAIQAEYDDFDRMTRLVYPDLSTRTFTYNNFDQLGSVSDASGTITIAYDALGKITSQTYAGRTVTYGYSADAKTLTTTYPNGRVVTKQLDSRLRLSTVALSGVAGPVATYTYAADDVPLQIQYGSGMLAQCVFGGEPFIRELRYSKNSVLVRGWSRGTNDLGSTTYVERLDDPAKSAQVLRDAENRVTSKLEGALDGAHTVPAPTRSEAFGLDGLGNWQSYTLDGVTETRTHDLNNRISERNAGAPVPVVHDADGRATDDGTYLYSYNYDDMLTAVRLKSDNSLVESYGYDPIGRLVSVTTAGGDLHEFVRDLDDHVIASYVNGVLNALHVYGANLDEHVLSEIGGTSYYYVTDLGINVAALTDASGTVVESYEYDAYGRPRFFNAAGAPLAGSAVGNSFLFNGRDYRSATKLYYYRARFLSPELGRFLTQDQLGINSDYMPNLYEYALSSPVDKTDPFGLCVEACRSISVGGSMGKKQVGVGPWGTELSFKLTGQGEICTKCCDDGGCGVTGSGSITGSGSASKTFDVTPPFGGPVWIAFKKLWEKGKGEIGLYIDLTGTYSQSQEWSYDTCEGKSESKHCIEIEAEATARGGVKTPPDLGCTAEAWLYGSGSYKYSCCITNGKSDPCKHCFSGKVGIKGGYECTLLKGWLGKITYEDSFDITIWNPQSAGCK